MHSAILYDLDGTLIDSFPAIEASARLALEKVLPDRNLPNLRPFIGPPLRAMLATALKTVSETELDKLVVEYRKIYNGGVCLECHPFAGTTETLKSLHEAGIRQFVVTNKPLQPTRRLVEHFGWATYFEALFAPDSQSPNHPTKTATTAALLEIHALDPRNCLFIGDARDDFIAAQTHGIRFLAASWGYGAIAESESVEILRNLGELPQRIETL